MVRYTFLVMSVLLSGCLSFVSGKELTRPTPQQAAWQDDEIGMFIHFGLETWQDKESDDETTIENMKLFDPPHVDTEQWVDVAESIGAKYIILVAKHVGGFCLWQTDSTEYSIKNSPYKDGKGDIMKKLSETCRRRGMKMGVYIYPGSIFHGAGIGVGGKTEDPAMQKEYDRIYRQQLTEVLSQYGKMHEVWFDGSVTIPVKDILDKYASKAMVFQGPQATIRWVGNERGYAPYPAWNAVKKEVADSGMATGRHGDPDGERWLPIEVDTVIRDHYWFWNSYNEKDLKSLDKLMDIYYNSVGHSSVLLLNIAPDTSGRIPQADVKRAAGFGAEVKRRFGESIAETKGSGEVVELTLDKPVTIDHVITMEDITQGERVREYVIEGLIDGNWEKIVKGISIGHKKIDKFDAIAVEGLRIRATISAAKPIIRKLAIYNVSGEDLTTKLAKPTPQQADWMDMEIGMFIHFGIETWQDKETDDEPDMANVKLFNPTNVDTDQWVTVAESMGAKYIILVAKHHGGFCLWQTDTTPYSIKNSPYKGGKGDIMAELSASCRKRGMKMGVYLSPADFRFGAVMGGGGKTAKPEDQPIYDKIYRQQLTEVLSRYGEMMEVWFDGSLVIEVGNILEKYAPKAMVFQGKYATIRWVGNEQGYASYPAWNTVDTRKDPVWAAVAVYTVGDGDPDGNFWLPNECDTVIRDHFWFWNSYSLDRLKSLDKLMDIYYNSVGHSSVLLLNVAPDRTGQMPSTDVQRAAEFGAEVKHRFARSIAETQDKGRLVEIRLDKPTTIDHVITMEEIRQGERVREYVIEGLQDGDWLQLTSGSAIGHKKIDKFEPIPVDAVRIRVIRSAAQPLIRKLAVYNVSGEEVN